MYIHKRRRGFIFMGSKETRTTGRSEVGREEGGWFSTVNWR